MPTLAETANGSVWVVWLTGGLLFVVSIVLLSGKGSFLIAGYNTAPAEEKLNMMRKSFAGSWAQACCWCLSSLW